MKIIVVLLTAYMSLLTVEPVLASVLMPAPHSCCSKMHHNSNQSKSCCPKGVCNPYQSCCCFVGFKVEKQTFKTLVIAETKVKAPVKNDKVISSFSADYFQPPEII